MNPGWPKINRYYMILPGDGFFARWRNRLTRRPVPRFPRNLQIQTRTGCNADCIFCPYGSTAGSQPHGTMTWELFRKIIDETARHPVRRISPYLMNEPLVDPEIVERIDYINRANPRARVVLTTNGSLLTPEAAEKLLDLGPGLHELSISVQGIDAAAYGKTMRGGMDFHRTMSNVEYFLGAMRRRKARRPALWITMVDTGVIDARRAVEYWRGRGVNARYTRLENRGGNIADAETISHSGRMEYFTSCTRLFKQAYIRFNGDMVLCCTDYEAKVILGNVGESTLQDVWNGPLATSIRAQFLSGRIGELSLCGVCKVDREQEVEVRAARPVPIALPFPRRASPDAG